MIKRLELQGFKSFSKKVSIPFSKGFTAIMGPNGSGKSNICDAILFVLGRPTAKTLRAERLTHLIYNGGENATPAKYLEVSIVLDNSKREYPFDSDEVVITRRLTRNGTMTYKINGERVTRARFVDFLLSAQLDSMGHNIVPQGEITSFIEMDPIQRRQIIDNLSGISEYDEKKAAAKKDLDKVEEKIKEVVILLSERKKHIEALKDEKEDAEKYKELKERYSKLEANLAFSKLKEIEEQEEILNKKIEESESKKSESEKELKEIESKIEQKEKELKELDRKLLKEGGQEQLSIKNEVERLQSRISIDESKIESKRAEISRLDSMISKLQSFIDDRGLKKVESLKEEIDGVYGTVGELIRVDPKYAAAIDSAMGSRKRYIVVDNEDTALKCVEYLKRNRIGRATFLPLNKIHGPILKPMRGKGIIGLAVNLIKFDDKFRGIFAYIFGNTYVVEELKKVKSLIGKFRMVSLDGDVAERSGAITGGYKKRESAPNNEIEEYVKNRDKLLDEIEETQLEIESLKKKLSETEARAEEAGINFKKLEETRTNVEEEIEKARHERDEALIEYNSLQRDISDLRIEKARVDAKLVDVKINIEKFKGREFEKVDIEKIEHQLSELEKQITSLEPVNMKAIELYAREWEEFKKFEEKFNKLKKERDSVIEFIEEIETKKKEVFYSVFNKVSEAFSNIYPKLSPGGWGELKIENEEDPLSGGLFINANPGGKKVLSLEAMSGGEKSLTALAFLLALQEYKPAPFYVLDEVDAALDQKNSVRVTKLLAERLKDAQIIVISHNNATVKEADSIFGVSMGPNGASKIVGIDLKHIKGDEEGGT